MTLPIVIVFLHDGRGISLAAAGFALASRARPASSARSRRGGGRPRSAPAGRPSPAWCSPAPGRRLPRGPQPRRGNLAASFQGAGFGVVWIGMFPLLVHAVEDRRREDMLGVSYGAINLGLGIGSLLAGAILAFSPDAFGDPLRRRCGVVRALRRAADRARRGPERAEGARGRRRASRRTGRSSAIRGSSCATGISLVLVSPATARSRRRSRLGQRARPTSAAASSGSRSPPTPGRSSSRSFRPSGSCAAGGGREPSRSRASCSGRRGWSCSRPARRRAARVATAALVSGMADIRHGRDVPVAEPAGHREPPDRRRDARPVCRVLQPLLAGRPDDRAADRRRGDRRGPWIGALHRPGAWRVRRRSPAARCGLGEPALTRLTALVYATRGGDMQMSHTTSLNAALTGVLIAALAFEVAATDGAAGGSSSSSARAGHRALPRDRHGSREGSAPSARRPALQRASPVLGAGGAGRRSRSCCRRAGSPAALAWAVHVSVDRSVGYGLRTPEGFQRT